jgi:lipopolysaccharide transport system permease protein
VNIIKSLWGYRDFIVGAIKRDFQAKHQNSLLGVVWAVLSPLALIAVYTIVFSQVMKAKLPGVESGISYTIYLCAGMITWGLFSEIVQKMQVCFLENANLLKKLIFPRMCLPIIVLGNGLVNFSIIFGVFLVFLIISGNFPGFLLFALAAPLFILLIMAIGLGVTLGVLNVFFRDVGQFFGIFLQFWFWLTPIVYPISILPVKVQAIIGLNPLAPVIGSFQSILVSEEPPLWESLIYPFTFSMVLCFIGLYLFRRHAADMVDEL